MHALVLVDRHDHSAYQTIDMPSFTHSKDIGPNILKCVTLPSSRPFVGGLSCEANTCYRLVNMKNLALPVLKRRKTPIVKIGGNLGCLGRRRSLATSSFDTALRLLLKCLSNTVLKLAS